MMTYNRSRRYDFGEYYNVLETRNRIEKEMIYKLIEPLIDDFVEKIEKEKILEKTYCFELYKHWNKDYPSIFEYTIRQKPQNIVKLETSEPYQQYKKYTFKERIKILMKGNL